MHTSIRVSEGRKEKLNHLKHDGESFDDLLNRLATEDEPIEIDAWSAETADRAREVIDRSKKSFER